MTFNIVHNRGQPNQANFEFNNKLFKVYREKHIFVFDIMFNRFVPCAPYDNHFVFRLPDSVTNELSILNIGKSEDQMIKLPDHNCTCGSMAVVKDPYDVKNSLFVCYFDATYGYHQTKIVNIREFDKVRGQRFEIGEKDKTWLKKQN